MSIGAPWMQRQRRAIRASVNPMDKSTIVSIYPREISEKKETIFPGDFHLTAGSYSHPSILVVGPSSWWRELDDEQPLLEIPVSSIQVADSVVKDYVNGLLAVTIGEATPGLFFLPAEHTVEEVKTKYKALLDKANTSQRSWFQALVRLADGLWANTNRNPLAISDHMRLAASELGMQDKEWLKDFKTVAMVRCVACGALRNPEFPVCQTCKAIADPEAAKKLNIQFAS